MTTKVESKLIPIKVNQATITIKGTSPLVQHQWSEKSKKQIRDKKFGKKTKDREICNPEQECKDATYLTEDGKYGIPAMAFKKAIITAAHKDLGIEKTLIKKSLFVVCNDANLVLEMKTNKPKMREDNVRVGNGGTDLRYRPEFNEWECDIKIQFNSINLQLDDVVNLINLAGFGVGVCENRPEKGGDWGRFEVKLTK